MAEADGILIRLEDHKYVGGTYRLVPIAWCLVAGFAKIRAVGDGIAGGLWRAGRSINADSAEDAGLAPKGAEQISLGQSGTTRERRPGLCDQSREAGKHAARKETTLMGYVTYHR